ncbi:P-loop containing nucleoside triphosphate hydrolase protein [Chytridium lagenaria]|nr:P-loop containing nucleoside triphosphate hydrolase protein [Chytridium lagenaria]
MWKSLIMLKNMDGSRTGSILAHAMGLGKTLQTIAFIYTLCREILRDNISIPEHMKVGLEFEKWIPEEDLSRVIGYVSVLQGNIFSAGTRLNILKNWSNSFGVLIISYDMFRVLLKPIVNAGATVAESEDEELEDIKATLRKIARDTLVDPGPSLIVCDEAHTIKNPKSMITILANQIKTPSRLCLTGYPLQNKLEEYWCMTQLHTLINLIEPVVLRLDNTPLQMELPPKKEFNIVTRLTTTQHAINIRSFHKKQQCELQRLAEEWNLLALARREVSVSLIPFKYLFRDLVALGDSSTKLLTT